jgi:tRNA(adenine34) deaminase
VSDVDPFDEQMMQTALNVAETCRATGDVPVGAVLVRDGEVLVSAGNARERLQDPTAHAEVLALREASDAADSWRLDGCTLYVTLEPCAMCAGAIVLARLDRVVFGASDPKAGFAGSLGNILQDERLNHRLELEGGLLAAECGAMLSAFFRDRRTGT